MGIVGIRMIRTKIRKEEEEEEEERR